MLGHDKNYRLSFIITAAVPIACAAAAVIIRFGQSMIIPLVPKCTIKTLTGFNCASCGATHSTLALISGDFLKAVYYNPLYIVFLGWLMYLYIRLAVSLAVRPYRPFTLRFDWIKAVAVGVIVLAFSVIRNLPFYQAFFY